jgi:protein O-mannosyl-transferase
MTTAAGTAGGWRAWRRWPGAGSSARLALGLAVPLALAVAASWRVLPGEFQFDDEHAIVENPAVKALSPFLTAAPWRAALSGGRPVTELTFALNYAYARLEPWNYHLTNLLIHLGAVVLAGAVARRLLRLAGAARPEGVAVAVAGLFALHPLQSQAVSYVVQRAESLAAALYLAGLLCLLHAEERPPGRRAAPLAGGFLLFAAGLGAKATVVTLPAAWLLLAALVPAPSARPRLLGWRARLLAACPFLALDVIFVATTVSALRGPEIGLAVEGLPPSTYLLTQLPVVATYLRLLAWPAGQAVDWHLTPARVLSGPVILSGLLLAALAGGALRLALRARRREGADAAAARLAGAGLLWFFLVLSPSSSVVPVIDLLVEHRAYLPALGVFLAAAVGGERALARLGGRLPAWAPAALTAAVWLALAGSLHARNAVWETRRALWSDAVAKVPDNPRAWANLALAASQEGRAEEAVRLYRQALPLAEQEPVVLIRLLGNLGIELARLGRLEEAEQALRRAVTIQPWPTLRNDLAAILTVRGKLDEAEALLRAVLADAPDQGEALTSLGKLRLMRGDPASALPLLDRAVALDPDVPVRHLLRARALAGQGRRAEACATLRALPPALERGVAADAGRAWRELGCGG